MEGGVAVTFIPHHPSLPLSFIFEWRWRERVREPLSLLPSLPPAIHPWMKGGRER